MNNVVFEDALNPHRFYGGDTQILSHGSKDARPLSHVKVHNTKNAATRRLSSKAGDAPILASRCTWCSITSLAATLIYVSQDRSDVQCAAKEIARKLDETEDGSQVFEGGGENDVGDAGVKMRRGNTY